MHNYQSGFLFFDYLEEIRGNPEYSNISRYQRFETGHQRSDFFTLSTHFCPACVLLCSPMFKAEQSFILNVMVSLLGAFRSKLYKVKKLLIIINCIHVYHVEKINYNLVCVEVL